MHGSEVRQKSNNMWWEGIYRKDFVAVVAAFPRYTNKHGTTLNISSENKLTRTPTQELTQSYAESTADRLVEYLQQRVSMVQQGSNTNFWDVALTLCTICAAVAHGRPVHGFFHVWRVARVVVVIVRIGPCSASQTFVDMPCIKGA